VILVQFGMRVPGASTTIAMMNLNETDTFFNKLASQQTLFGALSVVGTRSVKSIQFERSAHAPGARIDFDAEYSRCAVRTMTLFESDSQCSMGSSKSRIRMPTNFTNSDSAEEPLKIKICSKDASASKLSELLGYHPSSHHHLPEWGMKVS